MLNNSVLNLVSPRGSTHMVLMGAAPLALL